MPDFDRVAQLALWTGPQEGALAGGSAPYQFHASDMAARAASCCTGVKASGLIGGAPMADMADSRSNDAWAAHHTDAAEF